MKMDQPVRKDHLCYKKKESGEGTPFCENLFLNADFMGMKSSEQLEALRQWSMWVVRDPIALVFRTVGQTVGEID